MYLSKLNKLRRWLKNPDTYVQQVAVEVVHDKKVEEEVVEEVVADEPVEEKPESDDMGFNFFED